MLLTALHDMSDDELVMSIATLTGRARSATAALVAHLAELESRGLHNALGFRSLYGYCRTVLNLSEHESYNRMEAAGVARRFPVILPMLAEGLVHLSAVSLLGPRLGDENHLALLGASIHKSKREVEALLARWFPKPDVAAAVRKLPVRRSEVIAGIAGAVEVIADQPDDGRSTAAGTSQSVAALSSGPASAAPVTAPSPAPAPASLPASPSRPVVAPLAVNRHLVKFTATDAMIARLRQAQELLSRSVPSGDLAEIFDLGLIALIEKAARRKHAAATSNRRPRARRALTQASRSVPAPVEREVWARDGGACAFVGPNGRRCGERRFVEFHHVKPWAAGGLPTADNIALRCRAHNAYESAVYFAPIRAARAAREVGTRSGTSP